MTNFFAAIILAFSFFTILGAERAMACEAESTRACPVYSPSGDLVTSGTIKQDLVMWVDLCYPVDDWQSQQERTGQRPYYVSLNVVGERGVGRGIARFASYEDMKDAKLLTTQCYRQYYQPGWVVMTVTQCRVEGLYTFLTTHVLGASDNGRQIFFDDRTDLDGYAYQVR